MLLGQRGLKSEQSCLPSGFLLAFCFGRTTFKSCYSRVMLGDKLATLVNCLRCDTWSSAKSTFSKKLLLFNAFNGFPPLLAKGFGLDTAFSGAFLRAKGLAVKELSTQVAEPQ